MILNKPIYPGAINTVGLLAHTSRLIKNVSLLCRVNQTISASYFSLYIKTLMPDFLFFLAVYHVIFTDL
jgi:hypothetical protein